MIVFGFVVLALYVYHLRGKIQELQDRIDQIVLPNSSHVSPTETTAARPTPALYPDMQVPPGYVAPQVPYSKPEPNQFIEWFKQDLLVKFGALLLLLGFGWFVSYAFAQNWIGPMGRIALGLIAGAAFLLLGAWRIRTHLHQGGIFALLGSTTVLLTLVAARELYNFFSPFSALSLMFLSTVFVALLSVRYDSKKLALGSLILAALTPAFANVPSLGIVESNAYLLVFVLGTLWVVARTGWAHLTPAALVVVSLYGMGLYSLFYTDGERDLMLLFSFVFTAVFFIGNVFSILRAGQGGVSAGHLLTALGTVTYLVSWVGIAASAEWQSTLFIVWMLVFGVGAYLVYLHTTDRKPFFIYGVGSIALLGAATAAELDGPMLGIAFTLEAGVMVMLAARMISDVRIAERVSYTFLVPILLSFESLASRSWYDGFLHDDFFFLLVLGLSLAVAGAYLMERRRLTLGLPHNAATFGHAGLAIGSIYGAALVWLVLHAELSSDVATMFSLIVYTLIGLVGVVSGRQHNKPALRIGGGVLLGFVIVRLLLIEVWDMALTGRIITFFIIGALLISTAFIGRGKKQEVQPE